jgi:uncharacterized membrane protein
MAELHPQVVHFVIGLLSLGVVLRLVSLAGRPAFVSPAATLLLLLGTAASAAAVKSGVDAHGPVERMPGVRAIVVEHEEWGMRTRNLFFGVAALELLGLVFRNSSRRRAIHATAAAVGVVGSFCLYQAGQHGGEIVYAHAGGPGIRSGDPADVERLLLAGLYHQAQQDRRAQRPGEAAQLIDQALRRFPKDTEIQLLAAESALLDRRDPAAATAILAQISVAPDNRVLRIRHGTLQVDALEASGQQDAALAAMQTLTSAFPGNERLQQRLAQMKGAAATPR